MEPGIVYTAETVAKDRIKRRGEAECFEVVRTSFYAEPMSATDIYLTGTSTPLTATKNDVLIFAREGIGRLEIGRAHV